MRIRRFSISGFKNLKQCELAPQPIHAITGPNGTGKTNILEAFQFVSALLSSADKERDLMIQKGVSPAHRFSWIPVFDSNKSNPFVFSIESELDVAGAVWVFEYSFELTPVSFGEAAESDSKQRVRISSETLKAKMATSPGRSVIAISRNDDGKVAFKSLASARPVRKMFSTKLNMLALHALDVREGEDFSRNEPQLAAFRNAMVSLKFLRIDPNKIYFSGFDAGSEKDRDDSSIGFVEELRLKTILQAIQKNESKWAEMRFWLERLCGITDVLFLQVDKEKVPFEALVFRRGEDSLITPMLSTGNMYLVGVLAAIFDNTSNDASVLFIDEPEIYLHPAALVDLMRLLRTVSHERTVILTTHSPIALNCMKPEEVSLMVDHDEKFFTAMPVSNMKDAMYALSKGRISFGDLLQINYNLDEV